MCVKGVSTGLVLSLQGDNQLMKPIFWAFLLAMFFTLICQIRYLNKAMASFGVSEVCLCFAHSAGHRFIGNPATLAAVPS
jgi:hypothetical protein